MAHRGLRLAHLAHRGLPSAFFLWVLLCPGWVLAGVHVSPTTLNINESKPVEAFTLTNQGDKDTSFEVRLYRWGITDDQNDLEPTRDLMVSPPVFSLAPGESQTVRVALLSDISRTSEASYRAIFRELPSASEEGPIIGLQVALQISIPVFVLPSGAAPAEFHWQARINDAGELVLAAENRGGRHSKFTHVQATDGEGDPLAESWQGLKYVLPGTRREWTLTPVGTLPTGATATISTRTGRDAQEVRVPLE